MISVIIPVYNSAPYLRRAIDSVLEQTYENVEVILIDDGSTDGSDSICDSYISDSRVKVVHKQNEGQAKARNIGMDLATGEYVAFVDSDDRIEKDMLEYCIRLMQKEKVDAVLFDCFMSEDLNGVMPSVNEEVKRIAGQDILPFYMTESTRNSKLYSPCLCLYKHEKLSQLRFREGKIYEDIDFKYKYLKRCEAILVSNQIKYFYFVSGDSTVSGKLRQKNFELREVDDIIYNLTQEEPDERVRFLGKVKKARTAFSLLGRMARYGVVETELDEKTTAASLQKELRKNLPILLKAPIGMKRKVLALLLSVNYGLAKRLLRSQKSIY
ncbi:MAG: glycosyltransferase family 2 protein [Bacteroidaceae bacterium]|nr:glycosyltransferase family 2 protein [Bacteroidaceae bacterium]